MRPRLDLCVTLEAFPPGDHHQYTYTRIVPTLQTCQGLRVESPSYAC